MSLIIALPRERRPGERRVALDPSRVERLLQEGLQVRIEAECGHAASFHDEAYHDVEVFNSFAEVVRGADIIVKVVCPTLEEIYLLPPHSVLICIMSAFQHLKELQALQERQITVLGMDHLPRTTRAQPMDALSSQATVAGYKAALLAAELSPRLFPMLTTAAGTIRPSRVLVVGAGVAGLQAIATSRRLGAQVEAYDIRQAAKEQIESLGARMVDTGVEVEGAGGVARALRKDEKQLQHDVLAEHMARAHVVICAAALPGRRAPRIITEDMVDGMLPESVIVDMAASTGGNCELTRVGEHYYYNDTLIVGPLHLPSHGAVHASEMYARNVYNMLHLIVVDNEVTLNPEDEIITRCVLMHAGQVNQPAIASLLETEAIPFGRPTNVAEELPDQNSGWLREESELTEEERAEIIEAAAEDERRQDSESNTDTMQEVLHILDKDTIGASASSTSADELDSLESGQHSDSDVDEQDLKDLAALDGAAPDGTAPDGAIPGDASLDSSAKDGAAPDGAAPDNAASDGAASDGAASDGAASDGAASDGAASDGAVHRNGDTANTIATDGAASEDGATSGSKKGDDDASLGVVASGDAANDVDVADDPPRDELILIDGVGPALQERLYSFGFRQWRDLAELDDEGIESLTVQLELENEVREQDWCGQARRLMETQR